MNVTKRDGSVQSLNIEQIRKQTIPACEGLQGVSADELELDAQIVFTDGMSTQDIQRSLVNTASAKTDIDRPNWAFVAARLTLYDLYHKVKRTYKAYHAIGSGDVYEKISLSAYISMNSTKLDFISSNYDLDKLNGAIDSKRDLQFNYLGISTLISRYLLKLNGEITELPQHLFMGLAMWLARNEDNPTERAIEFYNAISLFKVMMATPTLSKGRIIGASHASCFVGSTPDNLEGILEAYNQFSHGSKHGGGFGWDWTRVRALGGIIGDHPNAAGGIIPWLKIQNDFCIAVDQLGVRPGSQTASIENWSLDVFDFIDLKKTSGEERRRADDLFLALSVSDLFMERVINDDLWTLFDPYDVPELTELWGTDFEDKYKWYEEGVVKTPRIFTNPPKQVRAKELWGAMIKSYFTRGMPFIMFKDTVNRHHKHPELGIIRSSNLCMEILQPNTEDELTVCNLGSLNLARIDTSNSEELTYYSKLLFRMLDNVIDLSNYPTAKAKSTQLSRRAIALGIMGMGEDIANRQIHYGSSEHTEYIHATMNTIRAAVDDANYELAIERGMCKAIPDNASTPSFYPIKRCAYQMAIAPTASISLIAGTTSAHEPVFGYKWNEDGLFGPTVVTAPNINPDNYQYYKSAYDIDQKDMINVAAAIQGYVDQSVSHNLYLRPDEVSAGKISDLLIYAWKSKLRTLYYLRSKSKQIKSMSDTVACVGCQ